MLGSYGAFVLHLIQLILAACVLGLSINAVKWQYYNRVPSTNSYAVFTGIFGCLAGFLGLMTLCVTSIAGFVLCVLDWLAALFFLAGGIAFAFDLRHAHCRNGNREGTWHNKLISGGCVWRPGRARYQCGFFLPSDVERRCRLAVADTVLLFLAMLFSIFAAVHALHASRKDKKSSSTA